MKTSGTPDTRRAARGRFPGLVPELRNSSQVFGAKKTFSSDSSPVFFRRIHQRRRLNSVAADDDDDDDDDHDHDHDDDDVEGVILQFT